MDWPKQDKDTVPIPSVTSQITVEMPLEPGKTALKAASPVNVRHLRYNG
jgi:hypothetical protein